VLGRAQSRINQSKTDRRLRAFVCEKSLKDKNAWALYPGLVKLETILSHHIPGIFAPTVVPPQNADQPNTARRVRLLIGCLCCDLFISCISKKAGPKTDFVQHTTTFQICVRAMKKLICVATMKIDPPFYIRPLKQN
jgi:hypothetical protein